eukprot:TRINITY_DN4019_c0_g1_i9.p1 TRINITY_DN4019_c0_g1~~TRINITY_DN4019_c0_g1_i9.p1  ORF type:complete len:361 (+),score=115.31 TRINITY_DN4019_c0_g1_i9:2-1084(+)
MSFDTKNDQSQADIPSKETYLDEDISSEKEKPAGINSKSERIEDQTVKENFEIISESKEELKTESELNAASSVKDTEAIISEPKEEPETSAASDQEDDDLEFEPEPSEFAKKMSQIKGMDRELKLLEDEKLELELEKRIIMEQIKRETDINLEHQDKLVLVKGESDAFMKSVEVYGSKSTSLQEKVTIRKFELITQEILDENIGDLVEVTAETAEALDELMTVLDKGFDIDEIFNDVLKKPGQVKNIKSASEIKDIRCVRSNLQRAKSSLKRIVDKRHQMETILTKIRKILITQEGAFTDLNTQKKEPKAKQNVKEEQVTASVDERPIDEILKSLGEPIEGEKKKKQPEVKSKKKKKKKF